MCLIWGSTWMMIKIGLDGAPPITGVGVRFVIASLVLLLIVRMRRIAIPRTQSFLMLTLFLAVLHVAVPYVLVYWAEQYISSGLAAVLYSTMPLMVALFARVGLGDPITFAKLAGIVVGIAGVSVIFSDSLGWSGGRGSAGVRGGAAERSVCQSLIGGREEIRSRLQSARCAGGCRSGLAALCCWRSRFPSSRAIRSTMTS